MPSAMPSQCARQQHDLVLLSMSSALPSNCARQQLRLQPYQTQAQSSSPLQLFAVAVSTLHLGCKLVLQADCRPLQLLDDSISCLELLR